MPLLNIDEDRTYTKRQQYNGLLLLLCAVERFKLTEQDSQTMHNLRNEGSAFLKLNKKSFIIKIKTTVLL